MSKQLEGDNPNNSSSVDLPVPCYHIFSVTLSLKTVPIHSPPSILIPSGEYVLLVYLLRTHTIHLSVSKSHLFRRSSQQRVSWDGQHWSKCRPFLSSGAKGFCIVLWMWRSLLIQQQPLLLAVGRRCPKHFRSHVSKNGRSIASRGTLAASRPDIVPFVYKVFGFFLSMSHLQLYMMLLRVTLTTDSLLKKLFRTF